jgi:hypothetical protein
LLKLALRCRHWNGQIGPQVFLLSGCLEAP